MGRLMKSDVWPTIARGAAAPRNSMRFTSFLLALTLTACAGPGRQSVPWPDEGSAVAADRCRVYVLREDVAAGSTRQVRVLDGEDEIGTLAEGQYLCWERRPVRGIGTLLFEGFAPKLREVENVFDLPREAATTSYFLVTIPHSGHQPQARRLEVAEGAALVAQRRPAR
jgi:hypothetical protein